MSDCRHETTGRKDHGTENFGGFVYVLDGFPQRDFVLCVFMCPTNISLFCYHLYCTGYHAEGYHAPSLPPRAITPVYTSRLSHQSYHAPPHTYIGLSHPLRVIRILQFTFHRLLRHLFFSTYATTGAPHVPTYSTPLSCDCKNKCIVTMLSYCFCGASASTPIWAS